MEEKKDAFQKKKEAAKKVDIVHFCEVNGFGLTSDNGRDYYGEDHDSLWVNRETNTFRWFSRGLTGDSIQFVETFFDKKFVEAVNLLTDDQYTSGDIPKFVPKPKEPFKYFYKHDDNTEQVEQYLCNDRGINPVIVEALVKKGLIRQSTYKGEKDCLFVWGKTGKRVGVSIQGTTRDEERYGKRGTKKLVGKNSEANYGFNVTLGSPTSIYFFESPIDLLSYWSIHLDKLTDVRLVAMTGLQEKTVWNMIQHTYEARGVMPTDVYIACDNDLAGQRFADRFRETGFELGNGSELNFHPLIPDDYAIPEANIAVYQSVGEQMSVDWKMIAAFHKAESNLSDKMELANIGDIALFFGEKQKPNEEKKVLDKEAACRSCAEKLASIRELKGYRFDKLFENYSTKEMLFINKVKHFYAAYKKEQLVIKAEVQKDWNDIQKGSQKSDSLDQGKQKALYKNEKEQLLEVNNASDSEKYQAVIRNRTSVIGHFEADSKEEMEKLIKIYGFEAVDKEDVRKYEPALLHDGHAKEKLLAR
ncbi:DUF3991 domain-containing protein [Listeria booriae]|uniref:toprim domain-containing protein n=1 Tax=Listeria booriae TaxID=1552123 RepID=UPI0016284628|nr:toprim domain-containing protein [Listeria booriae]MBC1212434.1 DUF3991 domain-containing protein [Listeria booriae]